MNGTGRLITATVGRAKAAGIVGGSAIRTRDRNLTTYLRVKPEQPQGLVWLVPQVGIDYTIESNTNWNIK